MRPGGWQMSLTPETPPSIVQQVRDALALYDSTDERWESVMDGQIVVFDTDFLTDPSLERARYTGIIDNQSGDRTFSGPGLGAYLQTDDGLGGLIEEDTRLVGPDGVASLVTALETFFGMGNGLTAGTNFTSEVIVDVRWSIPPLGGREIIDSVSETYWPGHEWRANPDGTVDSGSPDDGLFVTDPVVLVDAKPAGQFGSIRRINGTASSMAINCGQVTSATIAYPANALVPATATAAGTVARGLNGAAWTRKRAIDAADLSDTEGPSPADQAQSTQNLFEYPRSSFDIASTDKYVRRFVQPGDTVYVHFPNAGIKSTNTISVGAVTLRPQKVRVHEIDWGVHEGHGVWLRRHDGVDETWLRLTPYVQFSDPSSTWKVGTARGALDNVALGGAARLGTDGLDETGAPLPAPAASNGFAGGFPNESEPMTPPNGFAGGFPNESEALVRRVRSR